MRASLPLRRARRGFSLPELLISMVLISIIGLALTRLVVNESRSNNRQVLQRSARGVSRSALNIMLSELRMAEQSTAFLGVTSGNTPAPTSTFLGINVPWAIGVRCGPNEALMMPIDPTFASIGTTWNRGVAVRNSTTGEYDVSFSATVVAHNNYTACNLAGINGNGGGAGMPAAMPQMQPFTTSAVMAGGVGTPVMFYYQVRYTFKNSTTVNGRLGLFRQVFSAASNDTEEELVAPFDAGSGFAYYRGTNRMPGVAPAVSVANMQSIVGVQLNLVGLSDRQAQGMTTPERSTLSTAVFFRNRL